MQLLKKFIVIGFVIGAFSYYALSDRTAIGVQAKILPAPPLSVTGAPGEGTCLGCHYTYGGPDINNPVPNLGPGKIEILGLPATYTPGQNYTVTVRVSDPNARRWGFELTAIDVNGTSTTVGNMTITDNLRTVSRTAPVLGQSRTYISHTEDGTFQGQAGSASWSFRWTAPASTVGNVTFYAVGNAANNQISPEDDYIYATSVVASSVAANHPPAFASTPNRVVGVGDRISFSVSATDQDNDPMTISASALANATFDSASNRFTFTPAANQVGTQQVTFTVSDGKSQTQQAISLQVMTESSPALTGFSKTGASNYLDSSGATQIDLTVLGVFGAGAEIIFNGLPMATQSVTGGLAASLPASELSTAGAYPVRVRLGNGTLTNARALALASAISAQPTATVDAATFSATTAPGQIVSIFGADMVIGGGFAVASAVPLPRSLQSTTIYINGVSVPLFFTSGGQINYQMPYSTAPGQASVVVLRDDGVASRGTVTIGVSSPAVFTTNSGGSGQAVAINQDFSFNGDPAVNPQSKRAKKGEYITLYGSGTGAQLVIFGTTPPQAVTVNDGEAATVLAITATKPVITIGGKQVNINDPFLFSGLAPGFVGLWQLNLPIPADAPSGASVEVVINLNGVTSRTVTIAIE